MQSIPFTTSMSRRALDLELFTTNIFSGLFAFPHHGSLYYDAVHGNFRNN